ncbi:MAG TPA: Fur family transcriptional regulator [Rhabdaerophilum sp.]|nr:Fur family transcriptional regulator [Rhabdaerophilum sp.]
MVLPAAGSPLCWAAHTRNTLRAAGLRPTRQRLILASLLFRGSDLHVTAEELHAEAEHSGVPISLATVYNTLNQFTEAGLLRVLAVDPSRTYFDTNTADHQHFYIEGEGRVLDIGEAVQVVHLPTLPAGTEIANVDVVIRLRRRSGAASRQWPETRTA